MLQDKIIADKHDDRINAGEAHGHGRDPVDLVAIIFQINGIHVLKQSEKEHRSNPRNEGQCVVRENHLSGEQCEEQSNLIILSFFFFLIKII